MRNRKPTQRSKSRTASVRSAIRSYVWSRTETRRSFGLRSNIVTLRALA